VTELGAYSSAGRVHGTTGFQLTITPAAASISHVGQEVLFTVANGDAPFAWSVSSNNVGTITAKSDTRQAVYRVTTVKPNEVYATETTGAGRSGMAMIIAGQSAIKISPSSVTLSTNGSQTVEFVATGGVGGYTWGQSMMSLGTVNPSSGVYTSVSGQAGVNTIRATDADGNIGTATVTQQ
jgi:hypothetical protein